MSLSVKLFIKKSGSDEQLEVRRFSIDEDVSTSYEYLTAKIRATLPCAGDTAIGLFWQDEEGEMISFSSDEELIEALGHVNDGVLRVHVQLGCSPPTASDPVRHTQPHEFIGALASLLAGFTCQHGGGLAGTASGSSEPGLDDSRRKRRSGQETEREKCDSDETCHEGQDIRQLVVDTANSFLQPLGLKVVSCDEKPAAGATMTSSHGRDAEAGQGVDDASDGTDSHATSGTGTTGTATGQLNELMSALGLDTEAASWLSHLIDHHVGHMAQVLAASSRPAAAAACCT